jgi:hypothetical protein
MKFGRAIAVGILIWVLIFVEWSILIFMPVLKDSITLQYIIHSIVLIVWALIGAYLYYKSKDKINGFVLGLVFLIIGIILDMIITMPLFIIPQGKTYIDFFLDWRMWIGYIELIVVVGIYDLIRRK